VTDLEAKPPSVGTLADIFSANVNKNMLLRRFLPFTKPEIQNYDV